MSRPSFFRIVCCCLFACSSAVGWGQDYLDLPDEPADHSPTLTDRFLSLKDKFRREPLQAQQPRAKSSQRLSPRAPRYGGQAHRAKRSNTSRQLLPTKQENGQRVSRPKSNDLLPGSQFFSRGSSQHQPKRLTQAPQRQQSIRAESLSRAGSAKSSSAKSKPAALRVARKSPTTSRANELDAALADLLQTQPTRKKKTRAKKLSPKRSTTAFSNTFDLRKALLGDEEDSIAEEAAKAVEVSEVTEIAVPVANTFEPNRAEASVEKQAPVKTAPVKTVPTIVAEPVVPQSSKVIEPMDRPESSLLQTTRQPVIVSRVEGPRSIMVGREATYQVTLENTSSTPATDLLAEINVPEWAELVDAMSTSGVVERSDQGANAGTLEWKLRKLAPHSSQALRLRLIPRSGQPLRLGVRWSHAPVQTQAIVEVQEPKLELAITGPQEVRYGKPQRYRLTLRNPGTGLTEQVSLRLIPPGGDAQSATTQKIGDLKPGEVKNLDLELTARKAGELLIQADAFADGGLKAETTKTVLCRKPELKIDWRGPDKKYAGTVAAYYFRVRNPGTATTESVEVRVKLPAGAEFISADEGYSINTTTGVVSWQLAAINVREEQFMQLRCKITRPGKNDFELIAKTSDGELIDSKSFQTEVVALADLKLEVTDPQGPLPLGESVVYEIRVRNRGTTAAKNINIVGLFSEGIDPITAEGAQFSLRDGRVSFYPIKSLSAGHEILLRIHAKASQVGTHIFRTEVLCPELDIKLAAEEATRFFEDEHHWEDGQTPYMAERQSTQQR